ncbi:MAG: hypothetical protein RL701_3256 [Pseudomonadota bacterium]
MSHSFQKLASSPLTAARAGGLASLALAVALGQACGNETTSVDTGAATQELHALIGPEGGELVGQAGSPFAGVTHHFARPDLRLGWRREARAHEYVPARLLVQRSVCGC